MSYTATLVTKAEGQRCDICNESITGSEARSHDFHYSKTKRKTEVFIHKRCWDSLYKSEGK